MSAQEHMDTARRVFEIEAEAITRLGKRIGQSFSNAVDMILSSKGNVVVTGVGKSGLVARKLAATLSSTGTPAVFIHPTDAVHGDLGVMKAGDIMLLISNSGSTEELLRLVPLVRNLPARIISIVGDMDSPLAEEADCALDASVEEEACPLGLTPTASTAVAMAWGDALAVALMSAQGFDRQAFAASHPGGNLGKRLSRRVAELMHKGDELPLVRSDALLPEILTTMNQHTFGIAIVVDAHNKLNGIITDGDLRRLFTRESTPQKAKASDFCGRDPRIITPTAPAVEALRIMETAQITCVLITDEDRCPIGLLHIHDVLGRGQLWGAPGED